jgi:hypothetical protein
MARKYARDNRGRFASGGSGATARGGRLKTASGNKRATQTMKAAGTGGVIKGRTARTVAGEKAMAKMGKRGPSGRDVRVDRKLKELASVSPGVSKVITEGLRPFTPKNVNGVVVAARLEKMNKEGRLSGLNGQQMRRAQNAFNRGRFTASVAPQSFASQERIRLAGKQLSQIANGAKSSGTQSASNGGGKKSKPATAPKTGAKLDAFQRSEAKYAKRKYGVRSTVTNPGRKSRRAPRVTTSTGGRIAVTGRSRSQIRSTYRAKIADLGSAASRSNNIKATVTGTQGGLFGVGTTLKRYKAGKR